MGKLKDNIRQFYLEFSPYTEPKEAYEMLESYPEDINEMLLMIKSQYSDQLETGMPIKNQKSVEPSTVFSILTNSEDIVTFEDKHYALLLASILKHQKRPCRLRCNFMNLFTKRSDVYQGSWMCEVYEESLEKWFCIEPFNHHIRLPRNYYKTTSEVYLTLRHTTRPMYQTYYRHWSGLLAAKQALLEDLNGLMGRELLHEEWLIPSVKNKPDLYKRHIKDFKPNEEELIYRIAIMMLDPDNNHNLLKETYENYIVKTQ